jgi:hypothetical protein
MEELAAIDVPVLLVPGTDAEHPPEVSQLSATLPAARCGRSDERRPCGTN